MKSCNIPRTVVWFVGILAIICVVVVAGAILLERAIPDAFWPIVGGICTSLPGILSSTRQNDNLPPPTHANPVPTINVNPPNDPVLTKDTGK